MKNRKDMKNTSISGENKRKGLRAASICAGLLAMMMLGLTGCGDSYDPTGLVKANLDYITTGEVAEEFSGESDLTTQELKNLYEAKLLSRVDEVMLTSDIELDGESKEEMQLLVGTFITKAMEKVKYEVREEFTEKDGTYYVDVDVYPMELMYTVSEWIKGEEYIAEWKDMVSSGEYEYTTQEQLIEDIYRYMYNKASEFADDTEYGDAITMTVRVNEKDGVYLPSQEDLRAAVETALGE